jgi:hypothetical protein
MLFSPSNFSTKCANYRRKLPSRRRGKEQNIIQLIPTRELSAFAQFSPYRTIWSFTNYGLIK